MLGEIGIKQIGLLDCSYLLRFLAKDHVGYLLSSHLSSTIQRGVSLAPCLDDW